MDHGSNQDKLLNEFEFGSVFISGGLLEIWAVVLQWDTVGTLSNVTLPRISFHVENHTPDE